MLEKELVPKRVSESLRRWVPLPTGTSLLDFDVLLLKKKKKKWPNYSNVDKLVDLKPIPLITGEEKQPRLCW